MDAFVPGGDRAARASLRPSGRSPFGGEAVAAIVRLPRACAALMGAAFGIAGSASSFFMPVAAYGRSLVAPASEAQTPGG